MYLQSLSVQASPDVCRKHERTRTNGRGTTHVYKLLTLTLLYSVSPFVHTVLVRMLPVDQYFLHVISAAVVEGVG